jgi:hypothetical protein
MNLWLRTTAIAGLLALFALQANAGFAQWLQGWLSKPPVDYGFWQCSNCYIPAPNTPIDATTGPADLQMFIKANNDEIHKSKNESVHRWIPNSSITICNSSGVCITVKYAAASNWWLPAAGSYPLPPGKTPKVPAKSEISQQPSPNTIGGPGTVGLTPIGLPTLTTSWIVTLPVESVPHIVTPSVTVIDENGNVLVESIGSPVDLNSLNDPVGDTLDWGFDSMGLDAPGGGGGTPCYCNPIQE